MNGSFKKDNLDTFSLRNVLRKCRHKQCFICFLGKYIWYATGQKQIALGLPCGSAGKESACNVGDLGLIPGLRRVSGEGKGCPHQYSGLENSMDYVVHGVAELDTTE